MTEELREEEQKGLSIALVVREELAKIQSRSHRGEPPKVGSIFDEIDRVREELYDPIQTSPYENRQKLMRAFRVAIRPLQEEYLPFIAENPDFSDKNTMVAAIVMAFSVADSMSDVLKALNQIQQVFGHMEAKLQVQQTSKDLNERIKTITARVKEISVKEGEE